VSSCLLIPRAVAGTPLRKGARSVSMDARACRQAALQASFMRRFSMVNVSPGL